MGLTGCIFSFQPIDNLNEVNRLRRERDELQSMLEKFERHLAGVSSTVVFMLAKIVGSPN